MANRGNEFVKHNLLNRDLLNVKGKSADVAAERNNKTQMLVSKEGCLLSLTFLCAILLKRKRNQCRGNGGFAHLEK